MPLNLNPRMLEEIKRRAIEKFPEITVDSGNLVNFFQSFLALHDVNTLLPQRGKTAEDIERYTGTLPLYDFIREDISRYLNENKKYDKEAPQYKLVDLEHFRNIDGYVSDVLDRFNSLPWIYSFSVELPRKIIRDSAFEGNGINFGAKNGIRKCDLLTEEVYPLENVPPHMESRARGGGLGLLLIGPRGWASDKPYYRSEVEGFVGSYGLTNTVERVERELESILGLGIALRMFSFDSFSNKTPSRLDWIVHRRVDENWVFDSRFNVDESLSDALKNMGVFNFADSYEDFRRDPWISENADKIGRLILAEGGDTILLAAKWYYDSFKRSDSALKYVRTMTALEILLGDRSMSGSMSLSETIGNRLAFLIGKSTKERSEILRNFKDIYNLRSRILHQGKHKLSSDDFVHMQNLKEYCERAISAEVDMAIAG